MHGLPLRRLVLLALVALVVIGGSTFLGPTRLVRAELTNFDSIYWQFRVPRTLLAAAAGAGLALGGVVFQTLFRNPLATPYTLGIASGASLGAATATLVGWHGVLVIYGGYGLPVGVTAALAGGMLAMMLVLGLTRSRAGRDMPRLLLAGVCVAYLCAAGILLITYLADATVTNEIVMWLMGSLAMHRPAAAGEIALVLVPLAVYAGISARGMDLLTLGDELAASRGVAVGRLTYVLFIGTGILVAIIVANCGPIGFVGLMVPHILRSLVGERSLPLLIAALFGGAAFLAACDGLARVLARSGELPVGVLTNMLGAVFFFALLFRRGRLVIPR